MLSVRIEWRPFAFSWFNDYNTDRRHTSLYGEVPETVYYAKKPQATEAA